MKNKPIIVVLSVMFVISTTFFLLGFVNRGKSSVPTIPNVVESELVNYEYYLDDALVEEMPTNSEDNEYIFTTSECTNGMTIEFNEETWNYETLNKAKGVCKLYFNTKNYKVIITAANGLINENDTSYTFDVERLTNGQLKITPNEGYEYSNVSCSNDKEAIYDVSTNTLSINSVSENIACKIDFTVKNLTAEVIVKNGDGTAILNAKYGESVQTVVKADDGYQKPTIACSNNQVYTFENNKFSIAKLTENTKCTITFNRTPASTYKLMINQIPEQVLIISGNKEQIIEAGKDGKFTLKPQEGYKVKLDCNGVKPSDEKLELDGTTAYTFLGVNQNITCNVSVESLF